MSIALIDYGCHSFSYRLATTLCKRGVPVKYLANGSLESPNLSSLALWIKQAPHMVEQISCEKPYGKMGLLSRLKGEFEWGQRCVDALKKISPQAIIVSCIPLTSVTTIQRWALSQKIPFVYWLQDIQSRAIYDLLGRRLGMAGRTLGALAHIWEQNLLERSDIVITIAPGHENELPPLVRNRNRYSLLENWANIEEFPNYPADNEWSRRQGLDQTTNILYSGTLGLKHDLAMFVTLANHFKTRSDVRIVIVSSGQAAEKIKEDASRQGLLNLIVLPFQPYAHVPQALASASILIAPLDASAGAFCVPSKILSYLCAGRPIVIAIDESNAAAQTIKKARAGNVVPPGDPEAFITSLERLLDNEPIRIAAGLSAREYAESTFEIDTITERFLHIISRADGSLSPPPARQPSIGKQMHG